MRLLSKNAAMILATFLESLDQPRYGYELMQATTMKSGSLYPILGRFEELGWISGAMEPSVDGRPPRRVYRFEPSARSDAQRELDRFFEAKGVSASERRAWSFG